MKNKGRAFPTPKEVSEKVVELHEYGKSGTNIRNIIKDELAYDIGQTTVYDIIRRHKMAHIQETGKPEQDEAEEELLENASSRFEVIDDVVYMEYTTEDEHGEKYNDVIKIPIQVVDDIFMDYGNGVGASLSGPQITLKYNLAQYCPSRPSRVLALLRTRMDLNKQCYLWSNYTYFRMELQMSEEEIAQAKEERQEQAMSNKFSVSLGEQNIKDENRYLRREIKKYHKLITDYEWWKKTIEEMDINPVMFKEVVPENNERIVVTLSDLHFGNGNHDQTVTRLCNLAQEIVRRPESHVTILGIGDWFENLVSGYMHIDQEMDMDPRFLDPRDLAQEVVNLIAGFLGTLAECNKVVDLEMTGGNHDRVSQNNAADRYRMGAYWLYMVLESKIQSEAINIKHHANRVNEMTIDDICYIRGHGESDVYRRKPEEIINMYGNPRAKYYVILMGHYHSYKSKGNNIQKKHKENRGDDIMEGRSRTKAVVPPMTSGAFYSDQVVMRGSAPGALFIYPSEYTSAVNIDTKRL